MKEIAALAVTFLSVLSYFAVATQLGWYQRWPVVHLLVCLAAIVWLVRLIGAASSLGRRLFASAALVLSLALTGLFAWYTLDYSTYASTEAAVSVGEDLSARLGGMRLVSHAGEETPVFEPGGSGTLYVFYRGHW